MWVCSHRDKHREKPDHYTVLPSVPAEHMEIRNEVQHGGWTDRVCREGRTRAAQVQGQEQKAIMWGMKR